MTVAIDASAGHSRSQKIVQRARPQRPREQLIARALLRRELVGGRGVGGPISQVHLLQRESAQFPILTCN